ncbi:MAG: nucleotide sugar dehydrogenase [Acidimicrobiia bacterium]|jgi:UDP-N-acetyl-D-mannosaminuronic acid dehydrogenase|nr:nucleotide sugar dehydrogenase [Acidimicrobiia bacterium]
MSEPHFSVDVAVVGGCGHVGLPLGLVLADRGLDVTLFDVSGAAVDEVNAGSLPFDEPGAASVLGRVLEAGRLRATTDPSSVGEAEVVVVVIGTPIDEHLNPDLNAVQLAITEIAESLVDGQLFVLRSTVYPGVTAMVERLMIRLGVAVDVAFCPERIAESRAMTELTEFPQIVAARTRRASDRATKFFHTLTHDVVYLEPEEAELAKLFTNAWRYIKFATANQLYMMANDFGLDYERIRSAVTYNYPRAADLPGAGFAAGPCLFKDTMQLAAFNNNNFQLGQASVNTNEGLPLYLVARLERRYDLSEMTVGILGMSFKAESDDIRSSLSYKLKRILAFKAERVLTHDPHVSVDPALLPLEQVLSESDLLIVGAPHVMYRDLETDLPVVDIWNVRERGVQV